MSSSSSTTRIFFFIPPPAEAYPGSAPPCRRPRPPLLGALRRPLRGRGLRPVHHGQAETEGRALAHAAVHFDAGPVRLQAALDDAQAHAPPPEPAPGGSFAPVATV